MIDIINEVYKQDKAEHQKRLESMLTEHADEIFSVSMFSETLFYKYKRLSDIATGDKFYLMLDFDKNIYSSMMFKIHNRIVTDIEDGLEPNVRYWRIDKQWSEGTMESDRIVCAICERKDT